MGRRSYGRRGDGRGKYAPAGVKPPPGTPAEDFPVPSHRTSKPVQEEEAMNQTTPTAVSGNIAPRKAIPSPSQVARSVKKQEPRRIDTAPSAGRGFVTQADLEAVMEEIIILAETVRELRTELAEVKARPVAQATTSASRSEHQQQLEVLKAGILGYLAGAGRVTSGTVASAVLGDDAGDVRKRAQVANMLTRLAEIGDVQRVPAIPGRESARTIWLYFI